MATRGAKVRRLTASASAFAALCLAILVSSPVLAAGVGPDAAVRLAEFTAGASFAPELRRTLETAVADDWRRDPAGAARDRDSLAKVAAVIDAARDEPARAKLRKSIATALWWRDDRDSDPLARAVFEVSPVAASDPKSRLVLRRADLDGYCASVAIAASMLNGADASSCPRDAARAATSFAAFAPGDREVAADGERRAAMLAQYWSGLDEAGRRSAFAAARARVGADDPPRLARALESAAILDGLRKRLDRSVGASAEGLVKGATASAIGGAARGF